MGTTKSKINIENKCDCTINNSNIIYPYDYNINNGYYYIYFNLKKYTKYENNILEFSHLNNNISIKDTVTFNLSLVYKYNNILIGKQKYKEYILSTETHNDVKIRIGNKSHILYVLPINMSL